jgi:putative ABC transport system substrate-binding protein
MIARRRVLGILSAVMFTALDVEAGDARYNVGLVSLTPPSPAETALVDAFRSELRRLGYAEGQNLTLHSRFGEAVEISELLRSRIDVLVAMYSPASLAAKRATSEVPIVVIGARDPVGQGLARIWPVREGTSRGSLPGPVWRSRPSACRF